MKVKEIYCKTALSSSNLPGLDYSLNPYRGCAHSCAYCYVPSVLHIPRDEWGSFVEARVNIPKVLSDELKRKRRGVVGISTVTDPYQPIEKKYNLTRYCLEQILKYDFPIDIQTKSDLVLRDIDIISKFSKSEVGVTVTTLNDSERKLLEPFAPSIERRLEALHKLNEAGIDTYIFFGPIYPTVNVEDVPNIIEKFRESGTDKIMVDSLHLKEGVWDNIKKRLSEKYLEVYKKRLFDDKNYYSKLFSEIKKQCQIHGMKFYKAF